MAVREELEGAVGKVSYWMVLRAGLVPAVQSSRLPASLLERYEAAVGQQTPEALINTLRALAPITTGTAARTQCEGHSAARALAHKMAIDFNRRGFLVL